MAVEVTMPRFGLTMHEGTVQRFFKAPGESVRTGDPLFEVETEKILYEVESPAGGVLAVTLVEPGATVECGGLVAVIAGPGEDPDRLRERYCAGETAGKSHAPVDAAASRFAEEPASAARQASTTPRRAASPVARKLAADLGIALERVAGTGPGGRITREDVERAAASRSSIGTAGVSAQASQGGGAAGVASATESPRAGRAIPFGGIHRTIAERMMQSLGGSAQVTITTEADVTQAAELRERLSHEFELSYTDMLIHAVARALLKHPRMNARLEGSEIIMFADVNIGLAVALDDGLIVPVIRDAAKKSLHEIAALSRELGEKARAGRLGLEDVSGGTFTITNLGIFGVDAFTPILNPGETGILGMGRLMEKPAIYRGEIKPRTMMTLSLTFDHRVIDGAPAAAFLQTVVELFNHIEQ